MAKPRVAVFSPVRPVASGISDYCEESLALLAEDFDITLFVDGYAPSSPSLAALVQIEQAEDCDTLHELEPFDAFVYHLGNAPCHEYLIPFISRYPGLLLLHDQSILGTRLRRALKNWHGDRFRAEMGEIYGERGESAAEIILAGLHNEFFLRHYPLTEAAVRASRLTLVHDPWTAAEVLRRNPGCRVETLPHYVSPPLSSDASAVRARYGIPPERLLIGSFGLLTPDKGIGTLIDVFTGLTREGIDAHLLLAGREADNLPLAEILEGIPARDRITVTGSLPADEFFPAMAACDIVVQLRWPTRRESSAVIMQALFLGRTVVSSELAHLNHVPREVLVRVAVREEKAALRDVLGKLARCRPMRERYGAAACAWMRDHAGPGRVRDRWRELIGAVMGPS